MTKENERDDSLQQSEHFPHRVQPPGFIIEEEIGLGDAIKRATSYLGIEPCEGCGQRAVALNHWMIFTNGHKK